MFRHIARFSSIAAAVWLAACDNNPNPAPYHQTKPDGSPWVAYYWGLTAEIDSLDPQHAYDQMSRRVIEPIYDTLLEYHPLKTDPFELIPGILAEIPRLEKNEKGELSYLCRLKPDIRFHDDPCFPGGKGREIVSEDIHYIFQRICDPKVESPFLGTFESGVLGMSEASAAAKANNNKLDYDKHRVSGIEVIDRYNFRIKLRRPYPQLKYWMAFHCLAPVPREGVEYHDGKVHDGVQRKDFHKHYAVGTGAFRLQDYVPRQRVRLVRVPGYKTVNFPTDGVTPDKADLLNPLLGKPLPLVDEIHFSIMREPIPIFVQTRQGYLDRMLVNKDAFASIVTADRELSARYRDRGMFLELDKEPATFWVSFNMEDPVVGKNKKLRQALSCAHDSATYSEIFYNGVAPVATQLLPEGIIGHDPKVKNPYGYDLEKGKRLLAEAGYPNGRDASGKQLELTLQAVTDGGDYRLRAEFDQERFEKLGIKVKIGENDFPTLLDKKDKGQFQMGSGSGWSADYPDAENFFFLFYSKNIPPAGKNETRYHNPEFDKLFEQMAEMDDSPERLKLIRRMSEILQEDVVVIPIFYKHTYTVVQPWSRRTHQNHMLEGGVKYVTVDAALRSRLRPEWNKKILWPVWLLGGLVAAGLVYAFAWNRRRNA